MNKREFMKEIREYLEKAYIRLNPVEIEDIIRDYEEYFREGLSEGKSEEELVESMGDPKSLVDEMVRNDIEDGKYDREDFDVYFNEVDDEEEEKKSKVVSPKKVAGAATGFFRKLGKLILAIIVVLFDISYFPAVVGGCIGAMFGTLVILSAVPYSYQVFSYIGQNRLLLVFPVMFVVGAIILEAVILWLLVKLGIKVNKMVFGKKKSIEE